jgi:hypothetical protein
VRARGDFCHFAQGVSWTASYINWHNQSSLAAVTYVDRTRITRLLGERLNLHRSEGVRGESREQGKEALKRLSKGGKQWELVFRLQLLQPPIKSADLGSTHRQDIL